MQILIQKVVENYIIFLFFAGLLVFSAIRSGQKSAKKTKAYLILLLFSAIIWVDYYFIHIGKLPEFMAIIVPVLLVVVAIILRRTILPFKIRCTDCGKVLKITEFLFSGENICWECYDKRYPPEQKLTPEEKYRQEVEEKKKKWAGWKPGREFVIVFGSDDKKNVLMVDHLTAQKMPGKLSGIIAELNKNNKAPEAMATVASRALKKETGLISESPEYMGRLNFIMPKTNIRFHIFIGRNPTGELITDNENQPKWFPLKKLNYNLMSMDYPLWLPRTVRGQYIEYYAKCNTEGKIVEDILDLDVEL